MADGVFETAVDAALVVFDRALNLMAPPRHVVVEALTAAGEVYDRAADAEVDRVMAETGFAGMNIEDRGVEIRLKHAADIAAGMVDAFDALMETRGAENYVEWESTVTDPAREQAIEGGLPPAEWPPLRKYRVIVVKPDGKTPHELRMEAESKVAKLTAEVERLRDGAR